MNRRASSQRRMDGASLDLYLELPPRGVVSLQGVKDSGAGIYPCYWMRDSEGIRVATCVTALIADSGVYEPNPEFRQIDFIREQHQRKTLSFRLGFRLRKASHRLFGTRTPTKKPQAFYPTWQSIDRRIRKLRAFETVTREGSMIEFAPDYSLRDPDVLVERSAEAMTEFVQAMERRFPDHAHVALIGGRDSQLIMLIPKLNPRRWHVFSGDPNYRIVAEWLDRNQLTVGEVFRHDSRNDETPEQTEQKIVFGDLYSNPSHIRWLPQMVGIAARFDGRAIFWGGTMSSPAHVYRGYRVQDFTEDRGAFWRQHFERTASWQGNYHQVFRQFVGLPFLSPYHSAQMWELYRHLDPSAVRWGRDLREPLGERLLGRAVWWSDENPGPEPYWYPKPPDGPAIYRRYIERLGVRCRCSLSHSGTL